MKGFSDIVRLIGSLKASFLKYEVLVILVGIQDQDELRSLFILAELKGGKIWIDSLRSQLIMNLRRHSGIPKFHVEYISTDTYLTLGICEVICCHF